MKTFEDNEIIKALECCLSGKDYDTACMKCPIEPICESDDILFKYALDLINRLQDEKQALINGQETLQNTIVEQKAEIERLKNNIDGLNIFTTNHMKIIRLQAVKEFAERLKEKLQWDVEFDNKFVFESDIDNFVKEMME